MELWTDFRHGHGGEDSVRKLGAAAAIGEEGLAEELDGRGTPLRDGGGGQRVPGGDDLHHWRAEKVEDIGAKGGIGHLQSVDRAEFAGADSFLNDGLQAAEHGAEGLLGDEAHGVALALAEADHLLLHQGLESLLGQNAVEVLQSEAEEALARGAVEFEEGNGTDGDAAGHLFEGGGVERLLAIEVVVQQCFIHLGGSGDCANAGAGQAVLAELGNRGLEDLFAGSIRAG